MAPCPPGKPNPSSRKQNKAKKQESLVAKRMNEMWHTQRLDAPRHSKSGKWEKASGHPFIRRDVMGNRRVGFSKCENGAYMIRYNYHTNLQYLMVFVGCVYFVGWMDGWDAHHSHKKQAFVLRSARALSNKCERANK